ncbi:hypothetical protein YB2330_001786 [Saitoella coloradoensis]
MSQPPQFYEMQGMEKRPLQQGDIEITDLTNIPSHGGEHSTQSQPTGTQRHLKSRHVQMIAIGGTIGTGLFIGSGKALAHGGPVGALLGYTFMGIIVYFTMLSLGEMVTYLPTSGGFTSYATRFVDPAVGFATGWNYWYCFGITLPAEITAASIVIQYWDPNDDHLAIYITVMLGTALLINLFGAGAYGEAEFWCAIIKVVAIVGLIILGVVLDLGGGPNHDRLGFRYWKNPGAFNDTYLGIENTSTARFLGFWSVFIQAAFSYLGTEIVAVTAGEARAPRRNVPKAIKRVFFRLAVFYFCGILVIGLTVPYNSDRLLSAITQSTGAAASPFVVAITNAGIKGLDHVINAVILTSAFSAGNSDLYTASRTLYALALEGKAPRIFARVTRKGLPIYCVLLTFCLGPLAYLNVSSGASTGFNWLSNLSTVAGLFTWSVICWSYIRFQKGLKVQGISRDTLPFKTPFQPYAAYIALVSLSIIIFFNGFSVFIGGFAAQDFVAAYIGVPIFFGFWVFWKVWRRTKMVGLEEMDLLTGVKEIDELEEMDRAEEAAKGPQGFVGRMWSAMM